MNSVEDIARAAEQEAHQLLSRVVHKYMNLCMAYVMAEHKNEPDLSAETIVDEAIHRVCGFLNEAVHGSLTKTNVRETFIRQTQAVFAITRNLKDIPANPAGVTVVEVQGFEIPPVVDAKDLN